MSWSWELGVGVPATPPLPPGFPVYGVCNPKCWRRKKQNLITEQSRPSTIYSVADQMDQMDLRYPGSRVFSLTLTIYLVSIVVHNHAYAAESQHLLQFELSSCFFVLVLELSGQDWPSVEGSPIQCLNLNCAG